MTPFTLFIIDNYFENATLLFKKNHPLRKGQA